MKQTFKKSVSLLLASVMAIGVFSTMPSTAFAAGVDYNHNASTSTDEYYNLISKTDWDNAPGIFESEIILNNDAGDYRQVIHIMKADVNNSYVNVIPTYSEMNTSKYQTGTMLDQANWIDQNMDGEVIGVMNCCLSWYTGYPGDRVGEPLGFMMMNGEIMFDPGNCGYDYGNVGFPTCVVINKDVNDAGEVRPTDISKLEMVQIRTSADLDGWEDTVIPISSGYIVKDGVNQYNKAHNDPAPRSVVGITADGQVVMMENDGRQSPFSAGMNMYECAEVMIAAGCVWAANCDGGGSSTFVSQRPGEELKVNNSPSDGGLRPSTSGICFISTAPSDGSFSRASIETVGKYFTPDSQVQFIAKGADFIGNAAEIPEGTVWQLSDTSFGIIDQNGLFISNGTTGVVKAQMVYEGEVVGECEINIVIPDSIFFSQSTLTVPNGKTSTFSVSAKYGLFEVVTKDADFKIELGSANMGTLNGYELTATEDPSVTGGTVVATLTHNTSVTSAMNVVFGKASEVFYDFENGFGNDWYVEPVQKRKNWSKTEATSHYNIIVDNYAVTSENGMVHNGNGAGAIYSDNTYATLNWAGAGMYWANETVQYNNVKSIGAWIYIPKDAVSTAVRFCFTAIKDGKKISIDFYPMNFGDSLYFEESGWHYCSVDVSEYDSILLEQAPEFKDVNNNNRYAGFRIELTCQLNGGSNGEYNWVTTPGHKGINTFYVDDIIIDYSEACDDKEAPSFGEIAYVEPISGEDKYLNNQRQNATLTTYNNIGFSVSVFENTKYVNATGLNASSVKAYIDGNEVECTFNGSMISIAATTLTNGVHTVKFTICDNAGNYASVIRKINVQGTGADATVKVVPKVDTDMVFTGSQYWVDIIVANAEKIDEVTVALDLNNVNTWILDRIETLYGFEATYTTDLAHENILYLTIKRTGNVEFTGEQVLASIPVQTWEWKEEDYPGYLPSAGGDNDLNGNGMYDPYEIWQEYVTTNMDVIINPLAGNAKFVDGTSEWFTGDKIQVDTEQKIGTWWGASADNKVHFEGKSSWHLHVAGAATDKDATCTENGYIGRVFCIGCACVTKDKLGHECDSATGCGAVLDWGTTVEATGHEYAVNADGKLACVNGGELFNGVYADGKTYVDGVVIADGWNEDGTAYYVDGIKLTGSHIIDGVMCTFDENGAYLSNYVYDGWYDIDDTKMYFVNNKELTGYQKLDMKPYYFDSYGKGYEGEYVINGKICVFDNGLFVSCEDDTVLEAGWCGANWNNEGLHAVEYIVYNNGSICITGKGDMMNVVEVGVVPWSNHVKTFLKSIYIGKDITRIGNHAFRNCFVASSVVFEEGSNLNYIGMRAFFNMRALKSIVLPDGLEVLRKHAFGQTYNLQSVYLPVSLTTIENDAFYAYKDCLVLEVEAGSYAESFAQSQGIPYTVREIVLKNGVYAEDDGLYYYVDGVRTNAGLIKADGYYYYASTGGACKTGKYWVSRTNDLLKAGYYYFDTETGRMDIKNGVYAEDDGLYYYVDGVRTNAGLIKADGYYYYASTGGACKTGKYWVSRTNDLLKAGYYYFDTETGRMDIKNGVYVEDDGLYYYVDGVRTNAGLVLVDGYYYYTSTGGACKTGKYWVSRPNDLMPAGYYTFDAETGKMLQ